MTITLWTIFEILINFYQGGLETWFIYRFLMPRSHERAKIWAVIFAVCEGCLVTAFNYFTVFEGFGSALYWASLLVFAFCFFSDNAVKKFLSISLSQVAILLITSLELNVVSSFFKISLRKLVVEQSLLRFVMLIMIQISIFIVFRLILMAFKHTDDYTASDWVTIIAVLIISFFLVMVIHELSLSADGGHRLYINLSFKFRLTDILYFEGHRRKVSLFTVNGELEYGGDFSTVCGELLKYNFAIINRGILVNLDHIQNITKYDIILSNGRKIPIGKTYKDEIVARYLNYATGR